MKRVVVVVVGHSPVEPTGTTRACRNADEADINAPLSLSTKFISALGFVLVRVVRIATDGCVVLNVFTPC